MHFKHCLQCEHMIDEECLGNAEEGPLNRCQCCGHADVSRPGRTRQHVDRMSTMVVPCPLAGTCRMQSRQISVGPRNLDASPVIVHLRVDHDLPFDVNPTNPLRQNETNMDWEHVFARNEEGQVMGDNYWNSDEWRDWCYGFRNRNPRAVFPVTRFAHA